MVARTMAAAMVVSVLWLALPRVAVDAQTADTVSPEDLQAALSNLGKLEYEVRMNASRTIRRAAASTAVPALIRTATGDTDGFVRFRALVLLAGFNDPRAKDVMQGVLDDPNDRLRQVAYNYFEHAPDPGMSAALLEAARAEQSEFVRPSLIRALASLARNETLTKVREALVVDVDRGVDFFRGAVIEALGDYKAQYAVPALRRVAELDGPLQDDAVLALGKIGDKRALETFVALQRSAPRAAQPPIAAAICLLGVNCGSHLGYLDQMLRFGMDNFGYQDLLRATASGLGAIAASGSPEALGTLLDVGIPSKDPGRAPVALALGAVAIRNAPFLLQTLEKRSDLDDAVALLGEAFDMLEEDFEEERFFVTVRRTYWQAAEASRTRAVAETLIKKLEF
jgi:HEAT repeat protein